MMRADRNFSLKKEKGTICKIQEDEITGPLKTIKKAAKIVCRELKQLERAKK